MLRAALIVLAALVSTNLAIAQNGVQKPVESKPLFDAVTWQNESTAILTTEVKALERMIALHYDFFLGRPWTQEDYREEYTKRFNNFKKAFCPEVASICALPSVIEKDLFEAVMVSANELSRPETIQKINLKLKALGSPVKMSLPVVVPGVLSPEDELALKFNFIVGEFASDSEKSVRVKKTVVTDIYSYYLGYQDKPSANYFAVDANQKMYILDETLIVAAMKFSEKIEAVMKIVPDGSPLQLQDVLLKKYVSSKNVEAYTKTLTLIQAYEWIGYKAIEEVLLLETTIFAEYSRPYSTQTLLNVLVRLQKAADPKFYFFLMMNHSLYDNSPLFDQLNAKPWINALLKENVAVLLGHAPYTGVQKFSEWSAPLNLKNVFHAETLVSLMPEFHADLQSKGLLDFSKWTSMDEKTKIKMFETLLYPKSFAKGQLDRSQMSTLGLYAILGSVALDTDAKVPGEMAAEIIKVRLK